MIDSSSINSAVSAAASPYLSGGSDAASETPMAATASGTQSVDSASQDFEAVFLSQMMSQMFTGDDINNFFGGGSTGDIYKSYFMNELGKVVARAGGIGIAAPVKQELLKLQEIAA